jgi:hypothetical protein
VSLQGYVIAPEIKIVIAVIVAISIIVYVLRRRKTL